VPYVVGGVVCLERFDDWKVILSRRELEARPDTSDLPEALSVESFIFPKKIEPK
jgi:hypothetical protein